MQIIKAIILFLIFLSSSLIGRTIAGKYKYRLEELKEIKSALNIFKTKIRFTYEPIPEIFEEISKTSTKNIGEIFSLAKDKMETTTAKEAWEYSVNNVKNNLKEEDIRVLAMLSKMLGESDVDGQISQIDVTLNFIEKQIQQAEEEKNKNEKLYQKLGTITGLALTIILI